MSTSQEPDYLHPDGKPDQALTTDELSEDEKLSDASKDKAVKEADGHSIERKDDFLGTEGKQEREV